MNFIKSIKKENLIDISLGLFLASLPLPFGFINITFGLFILSCILSYKELKFNLNKTILLPIGYYLLCVISLFFSIDQHETGKYLSKGIFFLIIPLCFLFLPKINLKRRNFIFDIFSYAMVMGSIFYLIRATYRFMTTGDSDYFFYHALVTLEVNAIYISLFIGMAFIYLLNKLPKKIYDYISLFILFAFLVLLSSKNVIVITLIGTLISIFRLVKVNKTKSILLILLVAAITSIPLSQKLYERFESEFKDTRENVVLDNGIINVSLKNAWNQEQFNHNHYFNGSAFRIYQARIFKEIISNNHRYISGYGSSAVQPKIREVQLEDGLYDYYLDLNFHNQYLQSFATLGILGFLILLLFQLIDWIKSFKQKDILFFYFTLLTTSIMFTESLFERQRGIVFFVILFCIFNKTFKKYKA